MYFVKNFRGPCFILFEETIDMVTNRRKVTVFLEGIQIEFRRTIKFGHRRTKKESSLSLIDV